MPPKIAHQGRFVLRGGDARHRDEDDEGNVWITPDEWSTRVRSVLNGHIGLDPATTPDNPTKARRFYTINDNGLTKTWRGNIYVNPPYSKISPWIDKAIEAAACGARIVFMVAARIDAKHHQRLIRAATDVLLVAGRIKFEKPDASDKAGPAFGSMLVGLNVSLRPLAKYGVLMVPVTVAELAVR